MKSVRRSRYPLLSAGIAVLVCAQVAFGATAGGNVEAVLKKAFPQLKYDSIEPADVKGFYEVVVGQNIVYFYPEKEYLFVGDIYAPPGKSLTAEKRGELAAKLVQTLPLDKAVKVGNGKKVVIEFTDPDCPYCKKVSEYFKNRTDVTRYVYFTPLAHPQAINKVHYILAAKDKEKAYKEMMLDPTQPKPQDSYSEAIKALAQEHLALGKKMGVQGTPTMFVGGKQVVGADTQQLEQLLK
ncbi:DsbC family protein [Geomobilimonas luticola]|uniref:DsbC family protein n=1 Tax=Geomobilimonas luticola TaxID=1114878 RepID=A0ABS5SEV5_9BACT|nr:DsbC family protein [Geomobilimonas luticola]MBT0653904.1 DsbC family protein [Geomobilimonas luticola]